MIPPGEATLATITLTPVLKGEMPYVGVEMQRKVLNMPKRIADLARDFVYDRLPHKITMPRPWTYKQLLKRFTTPLSEEEIGAIAGKFPPGTEDAAIAFKATLGSVYATLGAELPVSEYQTYLGPKKIQPTSDKVWGWYSRYWVIDDPLVSFELAQGGALLASQSGALREYFPGLYEEMKSAFLTALTDRSISDAKFINLPPRADRGLAVFLGRKIVPYGSNIKVAKPEQQANPVAKPVDTKNLETSGQRAASFGA